MFGNPKLHGLYWVENFARGDKSKGEVKKRYSVEGPTTSSAT